MMIWIGIFVLAWLIIMGLMSFLWVINFFRSEPNRIDLFWGIGPLIAGAIFLCHEEISPPRLYVLSLLGFWGGRLSAYAWLIHPIKPLNDKLHRVLQQKRFKNIYLFCHYQVQGFWMVILALPFLFIGRYEVEMGGLQFALGTFVLSMIISESIADTQIYAFLSEKKPGIYQEGLWQYARHPNYWFEGLMWLGFGFMACQVTYGWIGLISPVVYYFVATEKWLPLMERGLLERDSAEYESYQKSVPAFWFGFKKSG